MAPLKIILFGLGVTISGAAVAAGKVSIKNNWEYSADGHHWQSAASPCLKPADISADRVTFRRHLPEIKLLADPVLFIETMSQPFQVNSGGKTIYEYLDINGPKNQFRGYPWHMIDLSGLSGDEIQITVEKNHQIFLGLCKKTFVGNRDEIYQGILRDDLGIVAVALILLVVGFASGVAAYLSARSKLLSSFSTLSAAIAIWIFTTPEVKIRLFLVSDPYFWMAPDHLALFIVPSAFIYYCSEMFGSGLWRVTKGAMYAHFVYFLAVIALMLLGSYDYPRGNYIFNLMIPFSTLLMTGNIAYLAYKNQGRARLIAVGLFIFVGFAVHDWLIGMWILNWQALLLHWGFLILMGFLGVSVIAEVRKLFSAEAESKRAHERYSAISEIAQMVAHDVKRPFFMLKVTLNHILESKSTQDIKAVAKENAAAILNSTLSIKQTLEDLTALEGGSKISKQSLGLGELITGILRDYEPQIKNAAIEITRLESFKGHMAADPDKMRRALANIVQNAIEAQPSGGEISISTKEPKRGYVEIAIASRSYIEPENVDRVFDLRFSSGKDSGQGLGLAIVKKFIELHNGTVTCRSDKIVGTEFTVLLPTGFRK